MGLHHAPKLFRTYDNRFGRHSADDCFIWEAGCATACAPSIFPGITVDGVVYADGGLLYNNPARLVLEEAKQLWGDNANIGCLISLGTGKIQDFITEFPSVWAFRMIPKLLLELATSSERVHQELLDDPRTQSHNYCRFNPCMMEQVGLEEWKKMDVLEATAQSYIGNVRPKTRTVRLLLS